MKTFRAGFSLHCPSVKLEPAGENQLTAQGNFRVGLGGRVVVTTTLAGKPPAKTVFNLK